MGTNASFRAVAEAAARVQQTGAQHEEEIELAERLCHHVRSFECVRIGLSGSESVYGAIRAALRGHRTLARGQVRWSLPRLARSDLRGDDSRPPTEPETAGQSEAALGDLVAARWNDPASIDAVFDEYGARMPGSLRWVLPAGAAPATQLL
jgi:glutamate-1-semialdehyde aminotransferase